MIPKIAYFYWGGQKLPYLRYLSLKTFCKQNPDWQVEYYHPSFVSSLIPWTTHEQKCSFEGKDYTDLLNELPIRMVKFDFTAIGLDNGMSEVHKSDLLRLYLLSQRGGLWSDIDIVFFKPMNIPMDINTALCTNDFYDPYVKPFHSVGFLLSSACNPIFSYLFRRAKEIHSLNAYQTVGAKLYNTEDSTLKSLDTKTYNIPMEIVYTYNAKMIPEIYKSPSAPLLYKDLSIGLHWFAGHPLAGEAMNKITPENYKQFNNVLSKTIELALEG